MRITSDLLRQIVPTCPRALRAEYASRLTDAMIEFEITNEARASAFLAEVAHESDGLKTFTEYASGSAYDHRSDLGNTRPEAIAAALAHGTSVGKFYKGHGAIQTTGFDNHKETGEALGVDAVNDPAILATPEYAFRAAAYFWHKRGLNKLADARKFKEITRRVNGGFNGLASRVTYYERALRALPDDFRLTDDAPPSDPLAVPDVTHAEALVHEQGELIEGAVAHFAPPAPAAQVVPVVPSDAPPVQVEATAVAKNGSRKSVIAALGAAASTLGVGVETIYGKLADLIKSGNPTFAVIAIVVVGAAVLIYWKYQDRQTRLDELREQNAHETTKLKMTIASDQTKNNVELVPSAVPVEVDSRGKVSES